jgi:hypothetical protein
MLEKYARHVPRRLTTAEKKARIDELRSILGKDCEPLTMEKPKHDK